MKTIDANIERAAWLIALDYHDGTDVQTLRWATGDESIEVDGDGTYAAGGPVRSVGGIGVGGARLEDRAWQITLADSQGVYKGHFASNWKRRECRLYMVTWPGKVVTLWKTGWVKQRASTMGEDGRNLTLTLGGILDRATGTKKRLMNPKAHQIAIGRDVVDDALDHAQERQSLSWGANA